MTRATEVPPLQYEEPVTVTSTMAHRGRSPARLHRFHLSPDFYVTVYEDGRVAITSLTHDVLVSNVNNFDTGSGIEVRLERKHPRFRFGPGPREADTPVEP